MKLTPLRHHRLRRRRQHHTTRSEQFDPEMTLSDNEHAPEACSHLRARHFEYQAARQALQKTQLSKNGIGKHSQTSARKGREASCHEEEGR